MKAVLNKVKPFIFPLAIAVIIYLLMRFVFVFGYVPTASMEPTLSKDSFILGNRIYFSLNYGDIVIFKHDGKLLVKRIAAVPGDIVDLEAIEYMVGYEKPDRESKFLIVPNDCYYVLGDNTQNSFDCKILEKCWIMRSIAAIWTWMIFLKCLLLAVLPHSLKMGFRELFQENPERNWFGKY